VFVEIGLVPNSDLVRELVIRNDRGEIEVDRNCRTGLHAAGALDLPTLFWFAVAG
jgi:alkyl hydroperoxide reductase subunit AhpF